MPGAEADAGGGGGGGGASSSSAADSFDAGQYAFFGKEPRDGLELGCLEVDGGHGNGGGFSGAENGLYRLSSVGEEIDNLSNLSDVDDLASTFAKLNRTVSGARNPGVIGDRRSISRGSSLTVDWTEDVEFPNYQDILENEELQEGKRWWSSQSHSLVQQGDNKPSNGDQHAYLQVDALGRVSFSSIRRPRSLLEVDHPSSGEGPHDQKSSVRSLEKEPMLAARVTVEDAIGLLLEVDDIDRLLQSSQAQDNSFQLRRRRQVLLEGLAASLQLVDPLGPSKSTNSSGLSGLAPKDDIVFLRIVSLPKGRKLLARYLRLIAAGSELTRIVCMAIFRHLRFLFGGLPPDSSAAETTVALAKTVSTCVHHMELGALSACLAAVVCSSEQPPLRPLGSSAGDGASLIIKSVLDRATELLTDQHAVSSYTSSNRALWQASFDAFFGLLTKYCLSKYESILQMFRMQASGSVIGSEASQATSREMPVELLRASLPHTNEQQRQMLLDFAQRTTPASSFNPLVLVVDTSLLNRFLVDIIAQGLDAIVFGWWFLYIRSHAMPPW
ncbi:hypothetical protein ZWY2020_005861 [Hordeum vulgare]|nr:hypothetical protein ZWY2020_005861 [Hordeum vulgare]